MTTAFQPKGEVAEWTMVYDILVTMDIGQVLRYSELDQILDRDFIANREPIYRAMRQLEEHDHRTLANVVNEGYRLVEAAEHEGLARHHHKKSRRQMRKSLNKIKSADRNRLDVEQQKKFDEMELTLSRHEQAIKRIDARGAAHAKAIEDNNQRLTKLEETLRRHGIEPD
jgi:LAS superfamily LD-carboxypeptidase LdcB